MFFPHFFILLSPQFPHKLLISAAFLLVLLLPSPSEAQLRREVNKHAGRNTLVSRFVSFQESSLTFLPCVSTADRRGEEEEERGRETKQEKEMAFPLLPFPLLLLPLYATKPVRERSCRRKAGRQERSKKSKTFCAAEVTETYVGSWKGKEKRREELSVQRSGLSRRYREAHRLLLRRKISLFPPPLPPCLKSTGGGLQSQEACFSVSAKGGRILHCKRRRRRFFPLLRL